MDTCQQIWLSLNSSSEKYLSMSIVLSNRFISDFINLPVLKEFHSLLATFSKLIFEDLQLHKDFIKRIFTTTIFLNYLWMNFSVTICILWGLYTQQRTVLRWLVLVRHWTIGNWKNNWGEPTACKTFLSNQPTNQPTN